MLRTLLIFIALLIVIGIALVATGIVNLRQDGGGVSIETSDVDVGTSATNVQLPVVRMETRQVELPAVEVAPDEKAEPAAPANAQ